MRPRIEPGFFPPDYWCHPHPEYTGATTPNTIVAHVPGTKWQCFCEEHAIVLFGPELEVEWIPALDMSTMVQKGCWYQHGENPEHRFRLPPLFDYYSISLYRDLLDWVVKIHEYERKNDEIPM